MRRRRGHLALTTRIDGLRCRPLVGERLLSGKKRRSPKGLSAFFISRRITGGGVGRQRGAGLVATASGRPCLWRRHFRMECVPMLSSLRLLRRGPTCTLGSGAMHLSHLRRSAVTGSHKTPKDQRQRKTRRGGDARDTLDPCSAPLTRLRCRTRAIWINFGQRLSRAVAATTTSFAKASERLQIVIALSVREGRISRCRRCLLKGTWRALDFPSIDRLCASLTSRRLPASDAAGMPRPIPYSPFSRLRAVPRGELVNLRPPDSDPAASR
jgi:hypothetical protein